MSSNAPRIPANMTGGVDLTGSVDFDSEVGDYIAGLNRAPEVIQTMTGAEGTPVDIGDLADNDGAENWEEDKSHTRALNEVRTAFDGKPVRVMRAARFTPRRILLVPGASTYIERDSRRTKVTILAKSATATDTVYVGSTMTDAASMGGIIPLNVPFIMEHCDTFGIAADAANNAAGVTVSVFIELQD